MPARIRAGTRRRAGNSRTRAHVVYLPDLGSDEKNRQLDVLIGDFVEKLAGLIAGTKD